MYIIKMLLIAQFCQVKISIYELPSKSHAIWVLSKVNSWIWGCVTFVWCMESTVTALIAVMRQFFIPTKKSERSTKETGKGVKMPCAWKQQMNCSRVFFLLRWQSDKEQIMSVECICKYKEYKLYSLFWSCSIHKNCLRGLLQVTLTW